MNVWMFVTGIFASIGLELADHTHAAIIVENIVLFFLVVEVNKK